LAQEVRLEKRGTVRAEVACRSMIRGTSWSH
jgi:hypothetical protein